jgi:hypothetical protein
LEFAGASRDYDAYSPGTAAEFAIRRTRLRSYAYFCLSNLPSCGLPGFR